MGWFARMALTIAVLAMGLALGERAPRLAPDAASAQEASGKSERSGGRAERSAGRSERNGRAERSGGSGRGERSGARDRSAQGGRGGDRATSAAGGEASGDQDDSDPSGGGQDGGDPSGGGQGGGGQDGGGQDGDGQGGGGRQGDGGGAATGDDGADAGDTGAPGDRGAPGGADPVDDTPVRVDDPQPTAPPADPAPTPVETPAQPEPTQPAPAQPAPAQPAPAQPAPAQPAPAQPAPSAPPPTSDPAPPVRVDTPPPTVAPGEGVVGASPPAEPPALAADPGGLVGAAPRAEGAAPPGGQTGGVQSLPDLIKALFGRRPAPAAPAPVVAPAPAATVAPVATGPARRVQTAPVPQAPRIQLSSGNGAALYRQHEIAALGLTPRARQVIGALGFRILAERRSPLLGNRVVARLRTPPDQTAEAALARARSVLPEVIFDLSHLYRPSGEPVPARYAAEMIGATPVGACRVDARIGLIDTGVGRHASLESASITRRAFVERDAATNVTHGTAIASILVGDLPGGGPLAPGAQVFSANVFVQDAGGLRADAHAIIAALDWMAEQRVPVINLSLMGPSNALLEAAARAAAERGQVLVAAAGNDGPEGAPAYPAAYATVIAVAAVDARGRAYGRNNRGAYVEVTAPGVDIWGADARGGEAFWTGTSFAAPFVTATLARDLAQGRVRNVNDGRARLAASARDLGAPGRDPVYGHGLLQVGGCSGTGGAGSVVSARD